MSTVRRTAIALFLLAAVTTACSSDGGDGTGDGPATAKPPAETRGTGGSPPPADGERRALSALEALPVRSETPAARYDREAFGRAWADVDKNACDTRNDILARDLTDKVMDGNCKVKSGTLLDPYTGKTIRFVLGDGNLVDIDHAVALGNVWISGGASWDADKRQAVANDPVNLLAVDAPANRRKGDKAADRWLPPNEAYQCAYVARQTAVKGLYGMSVTQAEKDAMREVLTTCPDEPLPTGGAAPAAAPPAGGATSDARPSATAATGGTTVTAFANCSAARAAGAAPLRRGEPGWNPSLDRDGDGTACE